VIAGQVDETWLRLARWVGGEALAADPRFHGAANRNANREAAVRAWCMGQPGCSACLAALDAAGVPAAPVQTIDEVLADPRIAARGKIADQQHPQLGKVRLPNLPFHFSDYSLPVPAVAPALGQHNCDFAAELGFSDAEIAAMRSTGALYS